MSFTRINYIFSILLSMFLSSCGMQDIGGAKVSGFAETSFSTKDVSSDDGDDRSYGVIQTTATQKIKLSANSKSEIIGASVVFNPGTFSATSAAVTVAVETGEANLYEALVEDLNLSSGNSVEQAAPSVVVRPSSKVEVLIPFSVTVPLPGLASGLFLSSQDLYERLAVLYLVFDQSEDLKTGLYSYSDLEIDANKQLASFKTKKFGSFQAILLAKKEETKQEIVSTVKKEIKNKKGEVLFDQDKNLQTYIPPTQPQEQVNPQGTLKEWLEIDWTDTHTHIGEGSSTSLKVSLKVAPSSAVTIPLAVSRQDFAVLQNNLSSLYFDSSNWDIPQTVFLEARENDSFDGHINFELTFGPVTSQDLRFSSKIEKHDNFYHYENDQAGLLLTDEDDTPIDLNYTKAQTKENGKNFNFNLSLRSKPQNTVTVKMTVSDTSEAYLAEDDKELSFTTENWSTPQAVHVIGKGDSIHDGDQTYQLTLDTSFSQDVVYQGLSSTYFNLTNINHDFNLDFLKLGRRQVKDPKQGAIQAADDGMGIYLLSRVNSSGYAWGALYKYDISSLSNKQFSSEVGDLAEPLNPTVEIQGSSSEKLAGGSSSFAFAQVKDVFVIGGHEAEKPKLLNLGSTSFSENSDVNNLNSQFVEVNYDITFAKDSSKIYIADNVDNASNVTVLEVNTDQEISRTEQFKTGLNSENSVQKIMVNEKYLIVTAMYGGGAAQNDGQAYVRNMQDQTQENTIDAPSGEYFYSAQAYGNYAYICTDSNIHIYNLSHLSSISKVGSINKGCNAPSGYDLYTSGDYLFVGDNTENSFYIYHLKNSETNPVHVNSEMGLQHKAMKFLYIKHHLYVFGQNANNQSYLTVFRNKSASY